MKKNPCNAVTQKSSGEDIGGIMKGQVDPGPADESGHNIEDSLELREALRKERRHHKRMDGMGAREAGVQDFSGALRKFVGRPKKVNRSGPTNKIFEPISDCRLDGIQENEDSKNLYPSAHNPVGKNEDNHRNMVSEMGEPW